MSDVAQTSTHAQHTHFDFWRFAPADVVLVAGAAFLCAFSFLFDAMVFLGVASVSLDSLEVVLSYSLAPSLDLALGFDGVAAALTFPVLPLAQHLTTKPDRGFGSNQVDLGGMIKPASATLINSSILVGYMAIATTQSSLHLLTSSLCPLIPPTKSTLGSFLMSVTPTSGVRIRSVRI